MGVFAGPKIPVKDVVIVADPRNSKSVTGSTTEISNAAGENHDFTVFQGGKAVSVKQDSVAGTVFSLDASMGLCTASITPVIPKYNFSVICWIKRQSGKSINYSDIWRTNTTDNPAAGYYFRCDTRLVGTEYVHLFVKDYNNNDWAQTNFVDNSAPDSWETNVRWWCTAVTCAQESEHKVYRDGELLATTPTTTEDLTDYGDIDEAWLGHFNSDSGCRVGYYALYRRALTAAEVKENFEATRARFGL